VTYAYLVEQADAEDSNARPAYRVAQVEEKDIEKASNRTALEDWLNAPTGDEAEREQAVLAFLTS
jgi:hypothetical protein